MCTSPLPTTLCLSAEGLKGGVPPPNGAGGHPSAAAGGAGGPSFSYSGVDPDMARRLFESLFGGGGGAGGGPGGFSFATAGDRGGPSSGAGPSFQFMSTGPGGAFMRSSAAGPAGFNGSSGGGGGSGGANRRRWASAFGGDGSDEEMTYTDGASGADPFAAFGMGPSGGFFQQQQQQWPGGSGSSGGGGGWSGSSAGSSPRSAGGFGASHRHQQQQQQQPSPQVVALPLTLEELYSGCTKRLKVTRGMRGCATPSCFVRSLKGQGSACHALA